MNTRFAGFRPSLVPALVKVAFIGSWNGRTFLHDNEVFDDIADFEPAGQPVVNAQAEAAMLSDLDQLDERSRAEQALIAQLQAEESLIARARAGHDAKSSGSAA